MASIKASVNKTRFAYYTRGGEDAASVGKQWSLRLNSAGCLLELATFLVLLFRKRRLQKEFDF